MDLFDPILDQPQTIDVVELDPEASYRLANQEVAFTVDAKTDLHELHWPWAGANYARHIRLKIFDPHDPHDEGLMVLTTRYFTGHQETILGSEGLIITKRLAVPLHASYDRAVMWMLECQAEGDRLMRLVVEIDWGEPLTQRIVDGLLVAQLNPGRAQGIYKQQNAESTRVFGNPQGRPSEVELDDETGRARLVYYVLINGIVEVPLLLTISDVGEQVAWNGFLALRDAERAFEMSVESWEKAMKTGRLWTPDPRLNRSVYLGRTATARHLQRFRTGVAPENRRVTAAPVLIKGLDAYDVILARNLLAHLRRTAEKAEGRLPDLFPLHPKEPPADPGSSVGANNHAYLLALQQHLQRHPDAELLSEHYGAVQACAEALIKVRIEAAEQGDGSLWAAAGAGLRCAVALATQVKNSADGVRWESEACELEQMAQEAGVPPRVEFNLSDWQQRVQMETPEGRPWGFTEPLQGMALAGEAVWAACSLQWKRGNPHIYPRRGNRWRWWAIQDLPLQQGPVTLVWDGETLHASQPVQSDKPVQLYKRIRVMKSDELDFDLYFEMTREGEEGAPDEKVIFHPTFDTESQIA
jgi:hypothetical protein